MIHGKIFFTLLLPNPRVTTIKLRKIKFRQFVISVVREMITVSPMARFRKIQSTGNMVGLVLTLDQGVMERRIPPIITLVQCNEAVAMGPPLFLAPRGMRRGRGCSGLQSLDARHEILHGGTQIGGDGIGGDAPLVEAVNGGEQLQLTGLKRLYFSDEEI